MELLQGTGTAGLARASPVPKRGSAWQSLALQGRDEASEVRQVFCLL